MARWESTALTTTKGERRMTMKPVALAAVIGIALSIAAPLTHAQGFSGGLTATSDYVFRGLSQTNEDPALQGEIRFDHSTGLYAGLWASNVDFGGSVGSGIEYDTFIGYARSLTDTVGIDVQFVRYNYSGLNGSSDFEYNEFIGNLSFAEYYTATLGYSTDVLASGDNGTYLALAGSWPITEKLSWGAGIGHYSLPDVFEDYMDWTVGLSYDLSPVTLDLAFIGTDSDARNFFGPIADNRIVGSVSVGF